MTERLLRAARAGDRAAFDALTEPHRGELQVHCYRMLGSVEDAEDAVQETLLSAWLGLAGFEGRASLRTWLYRIATNRCLNLLRAGRRVAQPADAPTPPTARGEVVWLQPYPGALLDDIPDDAPGPEARYESREAISLAFTRALQLLPPPQRAALLMRDVLGYRAAEAADLLGVTVDSLNGSLKRARAALADAPTPTDPIDPDPELLERFVTAFTSGSVDDLVALMTDDVWVRMPPLPFEYHGIEAAGSVLSAVTPRRHAIERMVPTDANRQPAWGEYVRDPVAEGLHLVGVLVVGFAGGKVCEITHFDTSVAARLGLPRSLA
ncbi:RNA polymerase subunit sigma-70 [Microbacterium sp. CFH 90308]|uniref:RNA polymerase subunit sigma-70 n=1 Tax=Microbacterium salsuginis TaxID=2722803 RepID=A0ABX1KCZ6_9MICO|nr:RNA polymerase subunit sigma-70 [Microbacterium sp. CFH 90308]NLP84911.1 RNA polymerase subunit sigma-70 [Microbacterium sp. CFH 90308]